MIRQIVLADQAVIRRKLKTVTRFDTELKKIVQDLLDTMIFANGAGLAANQIGVDAQIFVTGIGPKPQVFINPKLKILTSKAVSLEEGCLSVPGYRGPVKRSSSVEITYDDLSGRRKKRIAKGYLARVLQHESDHLQGRLYLDHINDPALVQKVIPTKVAFFGSGHFAVPILISLVGLNWTFDFQTVGVVTQPARPAGRKKELRETPVALTAKHFGLSILTPDRLDQNFLEELKKWQVDLIVLADYGKILPANLLKLPRYGALNIHPSLLPKYRGATPIQQTILNGDEETGVTLIKMSPEVDAGGILGQYKMKVNPRSTTLSLSESLSQLGAMILRDLLPYYISGEIKAKPQSKEGLVAAPKLPRELGRVEPGDTPQDIDRKVRALSPWPGVYTFWKGKRVKILSTHLERGQLVVERLQPEGGKEMSWNEFKNGYPEFSLVSPQET
ncbi:MAG TPA: methionyl-tRNA formyltransferase [Patescibacteria group bacterium]|nr:methionyl-tRNA formyltransferase [Patescibacteria group bacterium]